MVHTHARARAYVQQPVCPLERARQMCPFGILAASHHDGACALNKQMLAWSTRIANVCSVRMRHAVYVWIVYYSAMESVSVVVVGAAGAKMKQPGAQRQHAVSGRNDNRDDLISSSRHQRAHRNGMYIQLKIYMYNMMVNLRFGSFECQRAAVYEKDSGSSRVFIGCGQ